MLVEDGFERFPGWECLWVHRGKRLFLSVYVDDFKMAGARSAMQPMWAALGRKLDLEPAVPLNKKKESRIVF